MTDRPGEGYPYRYSQLLKKLLSAKGGEPIQELAPELVAAIILENDRIEYSLLGDEALISDRDSLAAGGAGNFGAFFLWNPAGSGRLVTIEGLALVGGQFNASLLNFANQAAVLAAGWSVSATNRKSRDTRSSPPAATAAFVQTAVSPFGNFSMEFAAGNVMPARGICVLSAGWGIALELDTANVAVAVGRFWRERTLEDSETK